MCELEKQLLRPFFDQGIMKFYIRFVDDTLALVKRDKVNEVLQKFNKFDKNLKFTVDKFEDGNVHFLDIDLSNDGITDVYMKPTNTGQYANFNSFVPWRYKTSWAFALYTRIQRICSTGETKHFQISKLKKMMSWNGFPKHVIHSLVKKFKNDFFRRRNVNPDDPETKTIWLKIPYIGPKGDKLVQTLKTKLRRQCLQKIKFNVRVVYTTTKIEAFCSEKDKIPESLKCNVAYKVRCPGCGETYIGKTDCCFGKRMDEHATKPDQPMNVHLTNCTDFHDLLNMMTMPTIDDELIVLPNLKEQIKIAVDDNSEVIKMIRDKYVLAYLESFMIKKHKPLLNNGIKAAKELVLF